MRFLADESCDFAIVRALRAAGHDVRAVAELSPRADDPEVIRLAASEQRILLTEDRHFGQLVGVLIELPEHLLHLELGVLKTVLHLVERHAHPLTHPREHNVPIDDRAQFFGGIHFVFEHREKILET